MDIDISDIIAKANKDAKPKRHMGEEEHNLQCSCVKAFRLQHRDVANLLFAIPNGGRRDKVTGAKLKAEGVVAGVADLFLAVPKGIYHGAFIEMKTTDKKSKQSEQQKAFERLAISQGYRYVICRTLDAFLTFTNNYMNQ